MDARYGRRAFLSSCDLVYLCPAVAVLNYYGFFAASAGKKS
jgi:hypothetical protein